MANPYSYNQSYDLANISLQTVTSADPAPVISLLTRRQAPGGILPNVPFITDYEGFIELLDPNAQVGVELALRFTHRVGNNPDFISTRIYRQRVGQDTEETIPLNAFSSRTSIPMGSYTTQDGTTITVTESDFENPVDIQIDLRIRLFNKGFTTEVTDGSRTIQIETQLAAVHFWQLRGAPQPQMGDTVVSTQILDPYNNADDAGYEGLRSLLGVSTPNAEFAANPLYQLSESEIIARVPDAANRAYSQRELAIEALQFIAASNLLDGGAGSLTNEGRTVRSETQSIGDITKTVSYQDSVSGTAASNNRSEFLRQKGEELLKRLTGGAAAPSDSDAFGSATAAVSTVSF